LLAFITRTCVEFHRLDLIPNVKNVWSHTATHCTETTCPALVA